MSKRHEEKQDGIDIAVQGWRQAYKTAADNPPISPALV